MASVTFDKATRIYPGSDEPAVNRLSLDIADGEFLVLVGPSGCGKSTSLRMVAGLEELTSGRIFIGEHDVTDVSPKDRDIAMVFQNYALYPHMTVADNMGFALKIAGERPEVIRTRVEEAARILDLEPYLDREPKALSGGQRQRVAMGRAIVREPHVFLMDEPLSNLDAKLRTQTRTQISSLQKRLGITTIYVTHDQTEALSMGDRIAVLNNGVLQQVATPRQMYEKPANAFVAGFVGSPAMNLGRWRVEGEEARYASAHLRLPREVSSVLNGSEIILGFRPEGARIVGEGEDATFEIQVDLTESIGSDAYIHGRLMGAECEKAPFGSGEDSRQITLRVEPRSIPVGGTVVRVHVPMEAFHFFSATTGECLGS